MSVSKQCVVCWWKSEHFGFYFYWFPTIGQPKGSSEKGTSTGACFSLGTGVTMPIIHIYIYIYKEKHVLHTKPMLYPHESTPRRWLQSEHQTASHQPTQFFPPTHPFPLPTKKHINPHLNTHTHTHINTHTHPNTHTHTHTHTHTLPGVEAPKPMKETELYLHHKKKNTKHGEITSPIPMGAFSAKAFFGAFLDSSWASFLGVHFLFDQPLTTMGKGFNSSGVFGKAK